MSLENVSIKSHRRWLCSWTTHYGFNECRFVVETGRSLNIWTLIIISHNCMTSFPDKHLGLRFGARYSYLQVSVQTMSIRRLKDLAIRCDLSKPRGQGVCTVHIIIIIIIWIADPRDSCCELVTGEVMSHQCDRDTAHVCR